MKALRFDAGGSAIGLSATGAHGTVPLPVMVFNPSATKPFRLCQKTLAAKNEPPNETV
jgi:hypothetical protein